MNKVRRNIIARANNLINDARAMLEECRDEEQEYYDNMPESFQNGDKGTSTQEAIDALTTVVDSLEQIDLSDVIQS